MALTRSEIMSRIRSKDTKPEMEARRILSGMGVRYRLHRKDLPGRPDIYVPKWETCIHVNGCFFHGHGCRKRKYPKGNRLFWMRKIRRNSRRDVETEQKTRERGLSCLWLWECERERWPTVLGLVGEAFGG